MGVNYIELLYFYNGDFTSFYTVLSFWGVTYYDDDNMVPSKQKGVQPQRKGTS
jgi:outer membrane usher protein FimD/PapC